MKILIDLPSDICSIYADIAKRENRSRKNLIEMILINAVGKDLVAGNEPILVKEHEQVSTQDTIQEKLVDQIIAIRNRPKPSYITQKAWDAQKKKEISDLTKNINNGE